MNYEVPLLQKARKMGEYIKNLGMQAGNQGASGAIGGILGQIFGGMNDKRQLKQQRKLQQLQITGYKDLAEYQKGLDLQMWKDTSYPAQMEMLKAAGLNPGLMYGMGGGGGTTTGGTGAMPSGGDAPRGGGENVAMTGMGMQFGMMEAQRELIQAQTEKVKAETTKTGGVDTTEAETRIESLKQGITNAKQQEQILKIEKYLKQLEAQVQGKTINDRIEQILWLSERAHNELEISKNEAFMSKATFNDKVDIIRREAIGALLRNEATEQGIEMSKEQINKMAADIITAQRQATTGEKNAETQRLEYELRQKFGTVDRIIGGIKAITGGK